MLLLLLLLLLVWHLTALSLQQQQQQQRLKDPRPEGLGPAQSGGAPEMRRLKILLHLGGAAASAAALDVKGALFICSGGPHRGTS